jgi:PAS domain S-box-containing protein
MDAERRLFEAILTHSPDAMIYIDQHTGRVHSNPRAEVMLGLSIESLESLSVLEGRCYRANGNPLDPGSHPSRRALRGEFANGEELLIRRPDGAVLPILVSTAPVRDEGERPLGVIVQFQDLTPVKEAHRRTEHLAAERGRLLELAETERRRLEALLDVSPVGVFVAEAEGGRVLLVNSEARRILGLTPVEGDTLGRYEHDIVYRRPDGSLYPTTELPLQRALVRGEVTRAEEIRFELPDGRTVSTLVNAAPVHGPDGHIVGGVVAIQDLTALDAVERLRSDFLAIVSHELKTPLTAIKGAAATVLGSRQALGATETRELLEIIDEQADRLRDLVNSLIDMSRIEAGALAVTMVPTDLRAVLNDAVTGAARSGIPHELRLDAPEHLPVVKADRVRIGQVLANLLNNAAKFAPHRTPIAIHVEHDDRWVVIQVRDQGRGISSAKIPHLFRKFSQVHEEDGRRLTGSGLGLAISKGIVEAHGGRIWAESPGEGLGATFSFVLPTAPIDARAVETTRRGDHLGKVSPGAERTRVLAVDDDPQILRFLRRTLEEAGYHVHTIQDPAEIPAVLERESPDLVLLDLMLPGTSGFDVLERIRQTSGTPVIFLTASDRSEDTVRALQLGADDYLTKPFAPSVLLARIEATLRRRLQPDTMEGRPPLVLGDLTVDFAGRQVTVAGANVALSATEYKILHELAVHAGRVLTQDQILQRVWGAAYGGESDLLRSHIRNLRRKLGDDARRSRYIVTVARVGYRMPAV